MAVKLNQHDLEFILKQIQIAEAHAAGTLLTDQISQPHLPYGLRTVDGSHNNILPGRELWGAADQTMPRLFDPSWNNDADGDSFDANGPAPGGLVTNTNYNSSGSIADVDPRLISNLIVDQTAYNPAAVTAALRHYGFDGSGSELTAAVESIVAPYTLIRAVDIAQARLDATPVDSPNRSGAEEALSIAQAAADAYGAGTGAHAAFDAAIAAHGIELEIDGRTIKLPNVAPDEGLSAPFNSWMTFFGQFFDHGLDLISKGGNGTIYVPLQPDDPLYVPGGHTNFMVLTRATQLPGPDGVLGTADDIRENINTTTPFVDQNQTYTSHPSHQVFLREYALVNGRPVATGHLLDGAKGLPTWADVKAQARDMLGIELTDRDVFNIPLVRTDAYGKFIPDPGTGFAQVIVGLGDDGIPNTPDDIVISGTPGSPVKLNPADGGTEPVRTSHAFLDDIAHTAVPVLSTEGILLPDDVIVDGVDPAGNAVQFDPLTGSNIEYDNELLDRHFITGDGRGNENIGLTAVHHVFHSEHNRQVEANKLEILKTKDLAFINEWLVTDLTQAQVDAIPASGAALAALAGTLSWDGERLFQAARFATEMQYQHLVFEEFGRKIQPMIDPFVFNSVTDIDPAIFAEFANVVYRFGHSMLTEDIGRMFLNEQGQPVIYDENGVAQAVPSSQFGLENWNNDIGLIEAFLNPVEFDLNGAITHEQAAGAIFRGMTRTTGSEIDEFVVDALRNNLLGLPLDLPAINIARGRDTGMPTLNEAREQLYEATNSTFVKPYANWTEFAANLKTPASIVNFIAAYGTHESITSVDTVAEKRDAAMALVGLGASEVSEVALTESFESTPLAAPGGDVIGDPLGNYTTTAPAGWEMTGTGGLFAPAAGVVNPAGIAGANVAWLGQNAQMSRLTDQTLEEGARYRLSFDIGDRTNMDWPGGVARLVAEDGTVLASQSLDAPADGQWSTVTFETGAIAAELAGQGLRIEFQQAGGTSNQILVDDIRLDVVRAGEPPADRMAFLNGTGTWAGQETGLNLVDLWVGGLAEKKMPFGGMLGSTFNAVFEAQMEMLQDGDRFYYLTRTQGLNFLNELENNAFSKLIMANTDMTHPGPDGVRGTEDDIVSYYVGVDSFAKHDFVLHVDPTKQIGPDPEHDDPTLTGLGLTKVLRDDPSTDAVETNYIRVLGGEHAVIGGTDGNDTIIGDYGDDAIWGGAGDDDIEGGAGVDFIIGGSGDDVITDSGDSGDFIKGEEGDDVIANSNGLDVLMGGDGKDVFLVGVDATEVFGGEGDDFILGGDDGDFLMGNEGDDWIEGGGGFDVISGDNSELFFNSTIIGHDVMFAGSDEQDFDAESGDDIMVQGESVMRNEGMLGFDWATHQGSAVGAYSDLMKPIFTTDQDDILRDRFDAVEALSGWDKDDQLWGDNRGDADAEAPPNPNLAGAENTMVGHELDQAGIDRIAGLDQIITPDLMTTQPYWADSSGEVKPVFVGGNILLGGGGSDIIEGRGGDDVIDGDAWLNVRIRITSGSVNDPAAEIATVTSLKDSVTLDGVTKPLSTWLLERAITPSQLHIVREIKYDDSGADVAVFWDVRDNYDISTNADGSIRVFHREQTVGVVDPTNGQNRVSDGTDTLRNIEVLRFADGDVELSPPELYLQQQGGQYADNFNTRSFGNSTGVTNWGPDWVESGDNGSAASGQIQIDGTSNPSNALRFGQGDGAMITRVVDLSGASTATISYSANPDNLDNGEWVRVFFAADGVNFVQINEITGNGGNTEYSHPVTGPFQADAAIRFQVSNINQSNEIVAVDNLVINFTTTQTVDYETTFTENGADQDIASNPLIIETGEIVSARVVLINAQPGDSFDVPTNLPGNITRVIDASVPGQIIVIMTGDEPSLANWQAALQAVEFRNSSDNPGTVDRVIEVTVNDGFMNSNVARTIVNVVAVNDAPSANNDTVITNFTTTPFTFPEWALLRNDTDADGDALSITSSSSGSGLTAMRANGVVTLTDTGGAGGAFTYTVNDASGAGNASDTATVTLSRDTNGPVNGTNGANILVGNDAGSTFDAGGGDDVVFAGGGNDTIVWDVGDGRDFVDGGAGNDEFVVNGSNAAEAFVVYSRDAATSDGIANLREETEIVITRNGAVIAELDSIEEITINTGPGNDTVTTRGNFDPTSLSFSTITVNDGGGDDTVDISGMQSAHRIVFRSNGGNDKMIGPVRPQDVIEGEGVARILSSDPAAEQPEDEEDEENTPPSTDQEEDEEDPIDEDEDDGCEAKEEDEEDQQGTGGSLPAPVGAPILGTDAADVRIGTADSEVIAVLGGDDIVFAGAGNDTIYGGAGADHIDGEGGDDLIDAGTGDDVVVGGDGNDQIYAGAGVDRVFAGDGDDVIDAAAGNDIVYGGAGNDRFVAANGDGDDVYWGDGVNGGAGVDTLDMAAITANITVNLGSGGGVGYAVSADTGNDVLRDIENVTTGSGDDVIIGGSAVNVMDGGAGDDIFRFLSASDANGDTIVGFMPGDRIDLSAIDASMTQDGKQSFTLANGPHQLQISYETRGDGDYTVVAGSIEGADATSFTISIKGTHTLEASDFV